VTDEQIIKFSEEEAWVAYSMPKEENHALVRGPLTNDLEGPLFIIQGWDKHKRPYLGISAQDVIINARWKAEVTDVCSINSTKKEDYESTVSKTIDQIRSGVLEKAVISRIKLVDRINESLFELFIELKAAYPDAFTFIYHIPGAGTWCGASPELLLSKQAGITATMALAGTLPVEHGDICTTPWTEKERHEQRVIEEYVEEALEHLNLIFQKEGPKTVQAGSMVHIQTLYNIAAGDNDMALINTLHPGPAICGRPKEKAERWINEMESHNREHYCGYLGPWDIIHHKAIFIHLRSMRIYADQYALYLGGGITADSKVQSEWNETELKSMTMLSVIKSEVHG